MNKSQTFVSLHTKTVTCLQETYFLYITSLIRYQYNSLIQIVIIKMKFVNGSSFLTASIYFHVQSGKRMTKSIH